MAVQVQAAVEAQLLGANLTGMVSKTEETVEDKKKTTLEFLIMPSSLDENESITVEKVVEEINKTIYKITHNTDATPEDLKEGDKLVDEKTVKKAMEIVGLGNAELTFMQTFIHYKKVTEEGKADPITNITEYAIGIHIETTKKPNSTDFKFLEIKEAYINVWDTKNQKVLERMQIWTPEQLEKR